jgi:putative phosphoesterase
VIAVVSDTHMPRGARELPEACTRLVEAAEAVVHAGDFVAWSVVARLGALAPLHAVHGNCDEAAVVRALPARLVVDVAGLRLGVVHDAGPREGRHGRLRAAFPGCDAVVYGHSHLPEVTLADGVWILNPGSPTERRRAPAHTMITIRDGVPRLVALDRPGI